MEIGREIFKNLQSGIYMHCTLFLAVLNIFDFTPET